MLSLITFGYVIFYSKTRPVVKNCNNSKIIGISNAEDLATSYEQCSANLNCTNLSLRLFII